MKCTVETVETAPIPSHMDLLTISDLGEALDDSRHLKDDKICTL